jgi:diguanylate cyclase (GGDEF)-like protein/PAS domain S-box-containing protein
MTKQGETRWIMETVTSISYEGTRAILGNSMDITDRKKAEESLRESELRYRTLFNNANDAVFIMRDFKFIDCNIITLKIFGCSREQIIGSYPYIFSPPTQPDGVDSKEKALEKMNLALAGEPQFFEWRHCQYDGNPFDAEVSLKRVQVGDEILIQAFVRDITDRKRMEESIRALIITDSLTGLYNRRGFLTLAEQQLRIAERTGSRVLLLFADLDGMKQINDHLGHAKGDEALIEGADVLKAVFRESDILARVGGDEFAVLALGSSREDSDILKDRLQQQMDLHNSRGGRDYHLSISIGIAYKESDSSVSIDELMSRADALMYEHKKSKHL